MGFRHRTYTLVFADPTLDGLEVSAGPMSVDDLLTMAEIEDMGSEVAEQREKVAELCVILARALISWNVEDRHGASVPCDEAGLHAQPLRVIRAISSALIRAMTEVAPPLPERSSDGAPSPEESMPMEALSASPSNSPTPS